MLSTYSTPPPARLPSPLPLRKDSLSNSIAKQANFSSPLVQSREDVKRARIVLAASVTNEEKAGMHLDEEERARRYDHRTREITEMLDRMTSWVEELATLLQQAYKNQTELETALTLARSNLQLALANNEMLEEALKRGGGGGQDVGWRRWSEREGVRRSGSVKDYPPDRPHSVSDATPPHHHQQQQQQQQQQSAPSRFFNFKSSLQRISSNNTSPTATSASTPYASAPASVSASPSTSSLLPSITLPSSSRSQSPAPSTASSVPTISTSDPSSSRTSSPSPTHTIPATSHLYSASRSQSQHTQPTPREKELTLLLNKERTALKSLADAKTQLEEELESLSQALFEEANKMVSKANRKLAETEEELRIATAQKEALQGALRIVEGENGALRGVSGNGRDLDRREGLSIVSEAGRQLEGMDTKQVKGNQKVTDTLRDEVKTDASYDQPRRSSQSIPTKLRNPTHPAPSSHSHVPDEAEGQDTQTSSTYSISPLQTSSMRTSSTVPTAHSLNPNGPARISTTQAAQADPNATPIHRWSALPASLSARDAVRSEFEDAMRRMRELVGEDDDDDDDDGGGMKDGLGEEEGEGVVEGGYLKEKKGDVQRNMQMEV